MNLVRRIKYFFSTSIYILGKYHLSFLERLSLLVTFINIYLKRILDNRLLDFDNSTIKVVDFKVNVGHFEDFFWTFMDVFVRESYLFLAENESPVIIDGGGNIGLSTLYFKWRYPNSKIIVFEPHPDSFKFLQKNISLNNLQDIKAYNIALSDKKGAISLFGTKRAATIVKGFLGKKDKQNKDFRDNEVLVETDKLSDYIKDSKIDLLKLDIEGAESIVLSELSLSGKIFNIKKIIMEFHYRSGGQNKLSSLIQILNKSNFTAVSFNDSGDHEELSEMVDKDFTHFMLVAKPKENPE
jgi:FkbM family methyltransferase